eukprot:724458-Rhodomonas_salina.1
MEVLIWGYWSASLQRLSLKANAAISVFERAWARDLQELEFLNLEDCQLSSFPDVSSMLNLQELVLANNPIQARWHRDSQARGRRVCGIGQAGSAQ